MLSPNVMLEAIQNSALSQLLTSERWVITANSKQILETLHFIAFALQIGAVMVISLRLLGFGRSVLDRGAEPPGVLDGLARVRRRLRHRSAPVRADRDGGFLSAVVPRQDRRLGRGARHSRLAARARPAQSARLGRRRSGSALDEGLGRSVARACGRPSSSSLASCMPSCRWQAADGHVVLGDPTYAEFWLELARGDLATWIQLTPYAYATLEGIHLVGVAFFFGSMFLLDLRLLGLMPQLLAGPAGRFLLRISVPAFVAAGGQRRVAVRSVGRSLRREPRLLRQDGRDRRRRSERARLPPRGVAARRRLGPTSAARPWTARAAAVVSVLVWVTRDRARPMDGLRTA